MNEVQMPATETAVEAPVTEVETSTTDPGTAETVAETDEQVEARKLIEDKQKGERARRSIQKRFGEYSEALKQKDQQNAELQAMLKQALGQGQPQQRQDAKSGPPQRDGFNSYEDWLRADTAYNARQELRAELESLAAEAQRHQTQTQAQQSAHSVASKYSERLDAYEAKSPGFMEKVATEGDDVRIPDEAVPLLVRHPEAPLVMDALLRNPKFAQKLWENQGDPVAQLHLMTQFAAATSSSQISKAPRPGTPVGTRSGSTKDPAHMTRDEYYDHLVKARKGK